MPVQHALWKIDAVPERLASGLLDSEKQLVRCPQLRYHFLC